MGDTIDHPNFSIIDDFLDEDTWTRIWSAYQFMDLRPVTRSSGAWKLDDGVPLAGKECGLFRDGRAFLDGETGSDEDGSKAGEKQTSQGEDDRPNVLISLLSRVLEQSVPTQQRLLDGEWTKLVARPYVYPRDTGLSWHVDDHELYAGAFIYYAHPVWNAHFGGELLIAETDGEELPIMGYRFETEGYSSQLLEVGCGNFVLPKPNRLVVLAGAPHMIARVSPAAGHHVRASVAGFFLR